VLIHEDRETNGNEERKGKLCLVKDSWTWTLPNITSHCVVVSEVQYDEKFWNSLQSNPNTGSM
jgi:hypothetical protein